MVHFIMSLIGSPLGLLAVAVLLWSSLVFSDFLAELVAKLSPFGPEVADKEWLAEFFSHAAFYGGAVGAFIAGKDANPGLVAALAVLWFCFCIILSLILKNNAVKREHHVRKAEKLELVKALSEELARKAE